MKSNEESVRDRQEFVEKVEKLKETIVKGMQAAADDAVKTKNVDQLATLAGAFTTLFPPVQRTVAFDHG